MIEVIYLRFLQYPIQAKVKNNIFINMKELIKAHKNIIRTVKEQMGLSDYGM